ncbi:hypothetical protein V6N13_043543 [Hibiscus sabdariffa]|uniref:Uncharacterized protein n=1 Tax=Hibiscus sabdariffa TaxID=183260 RepID=A0ABR2G2A0_9ROSI
MPHMNLIGRVSITVNRMVYQVKFVTELLEEERVFIDGKLSLGHFGNVDTNLSDSVFDGNPFTAQILHSPTDQSSALYNEALHTLELGKKVNLTFDAPDANVISRIFELEKGVNDSC